MHRYCSEDRREYVFDYNEKEAIPERREDGERRGKCGNPQKMVIYSKRGKTSLGNRKDESLQLSRKKRGGSSSALGKRVFNSILSGGSKLARREAMDARRRGS